MADAAKTISLSAVSAAAEGAQLRQASHGCGCTRGSIAWVPSSSDINCSRAGSSMYLPPPCFNSCNKDADSQPLATCLVHRAEHSWPCLISSWFSSWLGIERWVGEWLSGATGLARWSGNNVGEGPETLWPGISFDDEPLAAG
ncbi:hypothetical protein HaLaN_01714 [Haematococcus lacustris]|uniref:Uncharacterized protein n=1 Tax=Haematococcus lacustris TaxID=44745 RepID=A0A699YA96_HAELA|nr:hypothetical protein HaLaN_01714 [Haematococcus lacustris]